MSTISDMKTLQTALKSGINELIKNFRLWYDQGSIETTNFPNLVLKYQCLSNMPSLLNISLPIEHYESGESVFRSTPEEKIKKEYFPEVLILSGDHKVIFNLTFGNGNLYNTITTSPFPILNYLIRSLAVLPYTVTDMEPNRLNSFHSKGKRAINKFNKFLKEVNRIPNKSIQELVLRYQNTLFLLNRSFSSLQEYNLPAHCEYEWNSQYFTVEWCVLVPKKVLYPVLVDRSKKRQYSLRDDRYGIAWCWVFGIQLQPSEQ